MRNTLFAAALAATLAAPPARAEASDLKIGYVDFQRALNEVDLGKSAKAALKKDFEAKQKILDREKAALDKLQGDFEKQSSVLSDDARRQKMVEIDQRGRDAAMKLQQFQKELSQREQEVTRGIYEKMVAITHEIAEAEGFTLVFERNDAGLVVAPASLDLTDELVRKFNARYPPGAEGARAKKAGGDKKKGAAQGGAPAKAP